MIERVFAARVAGDTALAGASVPIPGGVRLHCDALPTMRDLNAALLRPGATETDLAAALASDAPRVTVFADVAAPAGWAPTRLMLMVAERAHPTPAGPVEVELDELSAVRASAHGDAIGELDARLVAAGARAFAVRVGGQWAAWALDIGGCIDDVYALEPFRRRGLGRAVTQAALAAGAFFLWFEPSDDAAAALYRSLGMKPAGPATVLTRE